MIHPKKCLFPGALFLSILNGVKWVWGLCCGKSPAAKEWKGGIVLLKKPNKFLQWLDNDLEETLLMILLAAITVVMMAQVIMRYFFNQSMPWPEEFCRFAFIWSGFLSMGYCVRRGKMLKVDILIGFFPRWLQKVLDVVSRFITLAFFAYLAFYAYKTTVFSFKGGMKSAAMEIPMWIIYLSVVVGSALGFIRQAEDLIRYFFFKEKKEEAKEEGK